MNDAQRRGWHHLVTVLISVGRWAILVLGVLLAYIGFLSLVRGTAVRHVRGAGADGLAVAPDEPEFPLTVAMLTGTRLTPGNHVEIGLNGDGTFARLWDDLRSARKSIILQMYYGQPGRVADELRAILLDRAAAGVAVYVLYDAFGTADIAPDHLAAYRAAANSLDWGSRRGKNLRGTLTMVERTGLRLTSRHAVFEAVSKYFK